MGIGKLLALYGICIATFLALDFVWISNATPRFYKPQLGSLLSDKPNLPVAGVFYLLYMVGLIALAIVPGVREGAVTGAVWRGALFGLLAYATYDLTNLATIQGWSWQVTVADMAWGTVLNTVVAAVGFYAGTWMGIGVR
jgi:uncharacterized membrane protein